MSELKSRFRAHASRAFVVPAHVAHSGCRQWSLALILRKPRPAGHKTLVWRRLAGQNAGCSVAARSASPFPHWFAPGQKPLATTRSHARMCSTHAHAAAGVCSARSLGLFWRTVTARMLDQATRRRRAPIWQIGVQPAAAHGCAESRVHPRPLHHGKLTTPRRACVRWFACAGDPLKLKLPCRSAGAGQIGLEKRWLGQSHPGRVW